MNIPPLYRFCRSIAVLLITRVSLTSLCFALFLKVMRA